MSYEIKKKSFLTLVYNTMINNRIFIWLVLFSDILCVINIIVSWEIKRSINNIIFMCTLDVLKTKECVKELFKFVSVLISHYALSALIKTFKSILRIIVCKRALYDAEKEILEIEYSKFHGQGLGKIQDMVTRSSWALADAIIIILIGIPEAAMSVLFFSTKIWLNLTLMNRTIFFILSGLSFFCAFLVNLYIYKGELICRNLYRKSLNILVDTFSHFDVVKAFNNETKEVIRYKNNLKDFESRTVFFYESKEFYSFLQKLTLMLPHVLTLYIAISYNNGRLKLCLIADYNNMFMCFKNSALQLRDLWFSLIKKISDFESRLETQFKDEKNSISIYQFSSSIKLDNVDLFVGDRIINKGLNFEIKKGDIVGITGVNGAGKSVFIKTLLRFYNASPGIKIDGISIESIKDSSIRDLISYVPQDPYLFNNTVLYNLGYSQKKIDEEEIYRLCKEFGYYDFFNNLPDGFLTEAGENGKNLSGGQKQRINFMRAIIKKSPIIILDEPTANMDKFSEMELVENLFKNCKDRTILIIIHNLSLLANFKKILYFKKSKVELYNSYDDFILNK